MNWDRTHGNAIRTAGSFGSALNQLATRIQNNANALNNANQQTNRFRGNITNLIKSMVVFGTVLPAVNAILPTTLLKRFEDLVQVGKEWEYQIKSINSLLVGVNDTQQENQDRVAALDTGMQKLALRYGLTTQELEAAKESFSTLNVVLDDATTATDDLGKGLQLTTDVAKLSRAGFSDMNDALQAMFTAMSAGSFTTSQTDAVMDRLFETIKVGRVTFQQFNKDASTFIPMMNEMIEVAPDAASRMDRLTQGLQLFAAASLSMGSPRAAVGIANIFRDIGRANQAQNKLTVAMDSLRRRGQTTLDIRPEALLQAGPVSSIQTLAQALGPNSPLVNQYIAQKQKMGKLDKDEAAEREAASKRLTQAYFGEARAVRAFEDLTANGGKQLTNVMDQMATDIARGGIVDSAVKEWEDTMTAADSRLDAAVRNFQLSLYTTIAPGLIKIKDYLRDALNGLVDSNEFQRADVFGKIQIAASRLLQSFSDWFEGPGRNQVQQWGYRLGNFLGEALAGAFVGGKDSSIAKAALAFSEAFAAGVKDALPDLLKDAIFGAVGEGLLSYLLLRRAGVSRPVAALGSAGFVSQAQGMGGPVGQAGAIGIGGIGLGILGVLAARRSGRVNIPGMGATLADLGPMFRAGAQRREMLGAEEVVTGQELGMRGFMRDYVYQRGYGPPSPSGALPRGGFIGRIPGMGNTGALRQAESAAAGSSKWNMARWGGLGIGALATLATAATAPADNRWHDTLSMLGGVAGGALGGGLGGLLGIETGPGALITGAIGSMAGYGLGTMGGGMLGDWLDSMFGKKANGGGMGDDQAAQLEGINAMVFALNNSDVAKILEQIRGLISRGGGTGPLVNKAATSTATGGVQGGGMGDLTRFETSQFGDRQLSNEESLAACGPAAAVFFAKANGRNPTLREAVDLAKGVGWNTSGGMPSAASEADLLTKMGVSGATSGAVDWSRLQTDALAGRPSIVNIGPNGKFPGHFFQISGYNAQTGQFRVGASGKALAGGNEWMTAAQMLALGPASGAVYSMAQGPQPVGGATGSHADWVNKMLAMAAPTAQRLGIDPRWLVAMAASESNWGSAPGNELFGIKGAGTAGSVMLDTWERNAAGVPYQTKAAFAAYNSPAEAFDAFGNLLAGHYPGALNQSTLGGFVGGLKAGGYFTDTTSHYQSTLQGILNQFGGGTGGAFTPDMVGGGKNINIGTLIGQVVMDPSGMDINELAGMLADALMGLENGSGIGQASQVAPA